MFLLCYEYPSRRISFSRTIIGKKHVNHTREDSWEEHTR